MTCGSPGDRLVTLGPREVPGSVDGSHKAIHSDLEVLVGGELGSRTRAPG